MRCDQARQLFDAYLDGELSPSLATELGAHRLRCADCRQALALLEVSGHIVQTDQEPVQLQRNFTERLLDCMNQQSIPWLRRWRRRIYVGGPVAAAAVIALAFLGVFDNPLPKVLSEIGRSGDIPASTGAATGQEPDVMEEDREVLEAWLSQTRENIAAKRKSGESLRQMLDETLRQWDDVLDNANSEPVIEPWSRDAETGTPPAKPDEAGSDVEYDENG